MKRKIINLVLAITMLVPTMLMTALPASAHEKGTCNTTSYEVWEGNYWEYNEFLGRWVWVEQGWWWHRFWGMAQGPQFLQYWQDHYFWIQTGPGYYDGFYQYRGREWATCYYWGTTESQSNH